MGGFILFISLKSSAGCRLMGSSPQVHTVLQVNWCESKVNPLSWSQGYCGKLTWEELSVESVSQADIQR